MELSLKHVTNDSVAPSLSESNWQNDCDGGVGPDPPPANECPEYDTKHLMVRFQ